MIFSDTLFFHGTVESRADPLYLGRLQIRIDGIHPANQTAVATADLPWATVLQGIQSAGVYGVGASPVGPIEGSRVIGIFLDGRDAQLPLVLGTIAGGLGHIHFPSMGSGTEYSGNTQPVTIPATGTIAALGAVPAARADKAAVIARKLMDRYGLTDFQASGILGNLYAESGISPNITEGGHHGPPPAYGTVLVGYGYAQWTNSRHDSPGEGRMDKYIDYCKSNNLDPTSDNANYQYFCSELDGPYHKTIAPLKGTGNVEDAAASFMHTYENPKASVARLDVRQNFAAVCLKALSGANVPVRTTGTDDNATTAAPNDVVVVPVGNEPIRAAYRGVYPYNKTFRSESGHLIEIDDTPNYERLLTQHKTGTYEELNETGRRVAKIVGDNYTIVVQDDNLYVQGDVNIFVDGNANVKIGGDSIMEVTGDLNTVVKGAYRLKADSIGFESTGDTNIYSGGNLNATGINEIDIYSGGDLNASSEGDVNILASGELLQEGSTASITAGTVSLGAGTINLAGGSTLINNPGTGATVGPVPSQATEATQTGITAGLSADNLSYQSDDVPLAAQAALQSGIASGLITQSQLSQTPANTQLDTTSANSSTQPLSTTSLVPVGSHLVDTLKISTNFTLGQVSSFAAVSHYTTIAQRGLTRAQIVDNLSLVAKNVLEPILAMYPALSVTSGFRTVQDGKSQHEIGQAVDMQFGSAFGTKDYLSIAQWIRDNVVFDQLLLEGKSTGTRNPWIHVSFNGAGNRRQILSLWNGKVMGNGLMQMY